MQRIRMDVGLWPSAPLSAARLDSATILIYGTVAESAEDGETIVARVVERISRITASVIRVRINCRGGSRTAALAVHRALRSHGAFIEVFVAGVAFSAGSVIAAAGDRVVAAPEALFMLHGPVGCHIGLARELRHAADTLDAHAAELVELYARKCGYERAEALQAMLTDGEDHYFTAQEAMSFGLLDQVYEHPLL